MKTYVFLVKVRQEGGRLGHFTKSVDARSLNMAWKKVTQTLDQSGILLSVTEIGLQLGGQ